MANSKANKIALYAVLALNIVGLIGTVIMAIQHGLSHPGTIIPVLIDYICILIYGFVGYKKPHGNLLRYLMMLCALNIACEAIYRIERYGKTYAYALVTAALVIIFISGRLDKIKKNAWLTVLALVIIALGLIVGTIHLKNGFSFISLVKHAGPFVQWVGISGIYFARYAEHKEAGLADKA